MEIQEDSFSSDVDFDEEDEDEEFSTTDEGEIFDKDFLKCYSALKRKDDKIYDKDVRFFDEKETETEPKSEPKLEPNLKTSKPKMTLLDHQLSLKSDEEEVVLQKNKPLLSHYERELDDIKKEILKAGGDDSDGDDDVNDFLIRKESNKVGPSKSDSSESKINSIEDDDDPDIKELKNIWSDPKQLSEEDKFLRDYILNKRYITKPDDKDDGGFFSKDIDKLSDIEDEDEKDKKKRNRHAKAKFHSEESNFDEITRIPRNATQTIRDLKEKRIKKEKRLKRIEKRKKLKKEIEEDDEVEFRYQEGNSNEEELKKIMEELDKELNNVDNDNDNEDDITENGEKEKKKKKKRKRGGQKKPMVGVAPDRLLSYGLSKTKLKKSKLL